MNLVAKSLLIGAGVCFVGAVVLFEVSEGLRKKATELDLNLANQNRSLWGGAKPYNRIKSAIREQRGVIPIW